MRHRHRAPLGAAGAAADVLFDRPGGLAPQRGGDPAADLLAGPVRGESQAQQGRRGQPGIARGQLSWETLNEMHRRLREIVPLDDIEVCPHTDADHCECRKPKPGMLLTAADKLSIDLASSYFVGDTRRDLEAARAAGVTPILIDWPYNQDLVVPYRVKDLAEAARVILA